MISLFAAAAAASAIPAWKGDFQVYNFPSIDSCGVWTTERAKSAHNQALEGWVLGLITGLNAFGTGDGNIAPTGNATAFLVWIDNYCRERPLESVTSAGFALADELKRRSRP